MKRGFILLAFVSLLLLGSLASAQQASLPADPASASLAAIFSTPAQGCAEAKPASDVPAPIQAAFLCNGACSDPVCLGKARGTVCKVQNGQTYRCQPALYICAANDCQCWTGPLP